MGRIVSMSDAVFAFSMTFLVINLVLPERTAAGSYPDLASYLVSVWPAMVAYALSFFIIASWWGAQRRMSHRSCGTTHSWSGSTIFSYRSSRSLHSWSGSSSTTDPARPSDGGVFRPSSRWRSTLPSR
jgi:hypothetical protein